jgi:hypothetical protein
VYFILSIYFFVFIFDYNAPTGERSTGRGDHRSLWVCRSSAYEQVSEIIRTDWTLSVSPLIELLELPVELLPVELPVELPDALLVLPVVPDVPEVEDDPGCVVEPLIPVADLSTVPETSTLCPTWSLSLLSAPVSL